MPKIIIVFLLVLQYFLFSTKVFGISFKKFEKPILDVGFQGSWNASVISYPEVIINDNVFKMWYAGHNGSFWSTGYAESYNGIDFTNSLNNPVLTWNLDSTQPKNLFTPSILIDNGYKLWITTTQTDYNNFFIGYATSNSETNFSLIKKDIFYPQNTYFSYTYSTSPEIIKVNNKYQLWFSAKDIKDNTWKIGYAESTDEGVTWSINPTPVLVADAAWDGTQVAGPAVMFDGNKYQMYYHTNFNSNMSQPTYINYAESTAAQEGKIWTKPYNQPVISRGPPGSWDSDIISDASIVEKDGRLYLYYAAKGTYNGVSGVRIGLATDPPLPTATPIPDPTVTPNPTATPIPEPTPEPQKPKVVLIPGLGASWNKTNLLTCSQSLGPWTLIEPAKNIYNPVIGAIRDSGYDVSVFTYDWRRDPRQTAEKLLEHLNTLDPHKKGVYLLGHSLGGLVGQAFIQAYGANGQILKYLSVGTPHSGTVQSYPAWSADEIRGELMWRIAGEIIKIACRQYAGTNRQIIKTHVPAIGTLLPVFNYLKPVNSNHMISISQMATTNPWLTPGNANIFPLSLKTGMLFGTGYLTPKGYTVRKTNKLEQMAGNWQDGQITSEISDTLGDGTVLSSSAHIPFYPYIEINKNHSEIISSYLGITQVLNFFDISIPVLNFGTDRTESMKYSSKNALVLGYTGSNFQMTKPDGKILESTESLLVTVDPDTGSYELNIPPNASSETLYVIRLLPNYKTVVRNIPLLPSSLDSRMKISVTDNNEVDLQIR